MANMPTDESFTIPDDDREREDVTAEKFLIEMGLLLKVDDEEHFGLDQGLETNENEEICINDKSSVRDQNDYNLTVKDLKIFDDPFGDEFNPEDDLQKQLEKHPLPPIIEESVEPELSCDIQFENINEIPSQLQVNESTAIIPTLNTQPIEVLQVEESHDIEMEINKSEKNNKSGKRKLTEFGYLLQRKGFRLMRKYYKDKFEDYAKAYDYKKRVKIITQNEMTHMMTEFIQIEFANIIPILT